MSGGLIAFLAAFGAIVLAILGGGVAGMRRRRRRLVEERAAVEEMLDQLAGRVVALDPVLPPTGKASRYAWDDALRAYDAARDACARAGDMRAFAEVRKTIAEGLGAADRAERLGT